MNLHLAPKDEQDSEDVTDKHQQTPGQRRGNGWMDAWVDVNQARHAENKTQPGVFLSAGSGCGHVSQLQYTIAGNLPRSFLGFIFIGCGVGRAQQRDSFTRLGRFKPKTIYYHNWMVLHITATRDIKH